MKHYPILHEAVLLPLALLLARPAFAQTPASPPPPDLAPAITAAWSDYAPAPGELVDLTLKLANNAPATVPGPGSVFALSLSVPYTSLASPAGAYSAIVTAPAIRQPPVQLLTTKRVGPLAVPLPGWLVPQPFPAAYAFAQEPDGSYVVTLPAIDLVSGATHPLLVRCKVAGP